MRTRYHNCLGNNTNYNNAVSYISVKGKVFAAAILFKQWTQLTMNWNLFNLHSINKESQRDSVVNPDRQIPLVFDLTKKENAIGSAIRIGLLI